MTPAETSSREISKTLCAFNGQKLSPRPSISPLSLPWLFAASIQSCCRSCSSTRIIGTSWSPICVNVSWIPETAETGTTPSTLKLGQVVLWSFASWTPQRWFRTCQNRSSLMRSGAGGTWKESVDADGLPERHAPRRVSLRPNLKHGTEVSCLLFAISPTSSA